MNPAEYYLSGLSSSKLLYAYSLRRVVPGYTGLAITVRRGNTATVQDFSFDPTTGLLDTNAIVAFVGPTLVGYVSKWYDQSGNGNTLGVTGAVPSREPIIVQSGAAITRGGRLAMNFSGSNFNNLKSATTLSIPVNNLSIFTVITSAGANYNAMSLKTNANIGTVTFPRGSGSQDITNYNNTDLINLGAAGAPVKVYSMLSTPSTISSWKNNVLISTLNVTNTNIATRIDLGYQTINNGLTYLNYNGTHQEILIYQGNPSRAAITAEMMTYYGL